MKDPCGKNQELIEEISALQQRIKELEYSEARRKQAEEALGDSEERYRRIVEAATDAILLRSKDSIIYANPAALKLFRANRPEDLIGKRYLDLVHPDDVAISSERVNKTLDENWIAPPREHRLLALDGQVVHVESTGVPVKYRGETHIFGIFRDIARRKLTEGALRESEEKYRLIFEYSPLGHLYFDEKGVIVACNDNFVQIIGSSREALIGLKMLNLPDKKIVSAVQKALSGGIGIYEDVYHSVTGKKMTPVRALFAPINIDNGRILGGVGIIEDITERKHVEGALRESQAFYHSLVDQLPAGVFRKDIHGRYVFVSPWFCKLKGIKEEEFLGKTSQEVSASEAAKPDATEQAIKYAGEGADHHARIVQTGNPIELVEEYTDAAGRKQFVHVIKSPVFNSEGKVIGTQGILFDITERKQTEETLQRQNVYLESLNETALGLMTRTDLTDLFQAIILRAMSFSKTDEGWIFVYNPEDSDFECKAVVGHREYQIGSRIESGRGISAEVWRTGQTVLIDDYHVWPGRASGSEYDMRRATVAIPLRYEGQLTGILGLSYHDAMKHFEEDDLTMLERLAELASIALDNAQLYNRMKLELAERKQAEEENLRLVERLQRSEKMEALGQLAGGVAHDLNNVLGILSGYSELLLLEIPEGHRSRSHAEKILQSTQKGASIIQDLLTLARRGVTAADVINLNNVVSGFLKSPIFEKIKEYHPRVIFRAECDRNLLNIKGSPVHLEKTLMNLVNNAAESISGKGEVTIRTQSRYLDEAVRDYDEVKEGDYAVLSISDTGTGIPAENRGKIFEPFYTKKTMGRSGTGLGLAIVWGTVKDHNGYIDLQTEVGEGTTFTLYFPVTREKVIAPPQKEPTERYRGNGETVLVVDDIAEQREVASGLLTQLGYEVHAVSGGEEAVAYLKLNKADILVLDMIMAPGLDGLETYRRVLEINPKQKAILVSGFSETDQVREAQKLGAGAYVKKPYVMEKIGVAIRDELNRQHAAL